jgi:hypothetical protein
MFILGFCLLFLSVSILNVTSNYFTPSFKAKKIFDSYLFTKLPVIFSFFLSKEIPINTYGSLNELFNKSKAPFYQKDAEAFEKSLLHVLNARKSITYLDILNAYLYYRQYYEPRLFNHTNNENCILPITEYSE